MLIRKLRLPEYFPLGSETGRTIGGKVNINSVVLKDRCRRSVAVLGVNPERAVLMEDLNILDYLPAISIQTEHTERTTLVQSGCQPNLVTSNYRRGPTQTWNSSFPGHIL